MQKLLLLLIFSVLHGSNLSNTITNIHTENDKKLLTFTSPIELQKGVSGYVVHHIDKDHQVLTAEIVVESYNSKNRSATAQLLLSDILHQDALPHTTYKPQIGDEVLLALDYSRALLLAPNESIYYHLTNAINNLEWIHPDRFAAYLSYEGHPTPQAEDMQNFCKIASVGLLYIYAQDSLFTLDCKSMTPLQRTSAPFARDKDQLPFYSRIDSINKSWFGITLFDSGNTDMLTYDYHYLQLIAAKGSDINITKELRSAQQKHNSILEKLEKEKHNAREKAYNPLAKPSR